MPKKAKIKVKALGDPDSAPAQVEYQRRDEADICVTENLINSQVSDGKLENVRSMALLWGIPAGDAQRGNLTALRSARIVLHNSGPFPLNVRVERPFGFESDPTGCAFWEPLVKGGTIRVEAEQQKVVSFGFVNNNFIVPKREYVGGKDCVHLVSMAASRSYFTTAGNRLEPTEGKNAVALKISAAVVYDSDGLSVGTAESFVVRYYKTDIHMRYTNYPPSPPVSIGQLRCPGGQVMWCAFATANDSSASGVPLGKGGDPVPVVLAVRSNPGDVESTYTEVEGLDKTVVYDMDNSVPCYRYASETLPKKFNEGYTVAARKLRWYDNTRFPAGARGAYCLQAGWYLCMAGTAAKGKEPADWAFMLNKTAAGTDAVGINLNMMPEPTLTTRLTPSTPLVVKLAVKGRHTLRGALRQSRTRTSEYLHTGLEEVPWYDTIIATATVVIKVVKVAVEVAAVLASATMVQGPDDEDDDKDSSAGSVMGYVEIKKELFPASS